jgi:S1-C subfamily serine protease
MKFILAFLLLVTQALAAHPPTVRIIVSTPTNGGVARYYGSGTILDGERGLILTCAHNVRHYTKNNLTVEIFSEDDRTLAIAYGIPMAVDKKHDIALIRIRPGLSKIKSFVASKDEVPKAGDTVRVAGSRQGRIPQIRTTRIKAVHDRIETYTFQPQGTSGGGVYNHQGRLIGVIYATGVNEAVGYHCPIIHLHRLVEETCLKLKWSQYACGPFG